MVNDQTGLAGRRVKLTTVHYFSEGELRTRPFDEGSLGTVVDATDGRGGTLVPARGHVHVRMDHYPDTIFQLPVDKLLVLSLLDAIAEVSRGS